MDAGHEDRRQQGITISCFHIVLGIVALKNKQERVIHNLLSGVICHCAGATTVSSAADQNRSSNLSFSTQES